MKQKKTLKETTSDAPAGALPPLLTLRIGRADERARIAAYLGRQDVRLLILIGLVEIAVVHTQLSEWQKSGVWAKIWEGLGQPFPGEYLQL